MFAVRELNDQGLGELLVGFFHYYAVFPWHNTSISIRRGKTFPRWERHKQDEYSRGICLTSRSMLPEESSRFEIYIEEPFDGKNTARLVWFSTSPSLCSHHTLKRSYLQMRAKSLHGGHQRGIHDCSRQVGQ